MITTQCPGYQLCYITNYAEKCDTSFESFCNYNCMYAVQQDIRNDPIPPRAILLTWINFDPSMDK